MAVQTYLSLVIVTLRPSKLLFNKFISPYLVVTYISSVSLYCDLISFDCLGCTWYGKVRRRFIKLHTRDLNSTGNIPTGVSVVNTCHLLCDKLRKYTSKSGSLSDEKLIFCSALDFPVSGGKKHFLHGRPAY